jgi:predicted ester cyclase
MSYLQSRPSSRYRRHGVAERNKVAVRLNVTGTHKGEFRGIPPTGKKLSLDEMGFITIIDGKITDGWISSDTMRLLQQIGGLPPSSFFSSSSLPADSSSTACS